MPFVRPDPREGGVIQLGYFVEDIGEAMRRFSARLKAGPWFISGPFNPAEALYRGNRTDVIVSVANAYAGDLLIELIQQHNDVPSVYRDIFAPGSYGFHHWAIGCEDFDAALASLLGEGYAAALLDRTPAGFRVAYMDTRPDLPGMTEIVELTDDFKAMHAEMHNAARTWDGADPVRSWG